MVRSDAARLGDEQLKFMACDVSRLGDEQLKIMACDVSRICAYAPAIDPMHVRVAGEDFEPGGGHRCDEFKPMYRTRGAALNWRALMIAFDGLGV